MREWMGRAAAAILFVLALLAIPLAQHRGEDRVGVQTYAGQHDNAAPCVTAPNTQGQTASKDSCAGQRPSQHPGEGIRWTDIVVAISAIGNVLVALAIALFTGFLWKTSENQHSALLASVAEAAKAATAAKRSADSATKAERAYVFVSLEELEVVLHQASFKIVCRNAGRTPAQLERIQIEIFPENTILGDQPHYNGVGQVERTILPAGEHHAFGPSSWRRGNGIILGYIDYTDVFGQPHRIGFAFEPGFDGLWHTNPPILEYSRAGPQAWNYWN